jgi:hypothetical protein
MNYLVAMEVLQHLSHCGITAVIAGGSVRDTYHGKVPKDYDICVLGDHSIEDAITTLDDCSGVTGIEPFGDGASMADSADANLDWVIKFVCRGVHFDLIQFASLPSTPTELVESFDCTLNMAWLAEDGEVILHDDYPEPFGKVHILPLCDFPVARVLYLSEKYPQYQWPTAEELIAHPNYKQGT